MPVQRLPKTKQFFFFISQMKYALRYVDELFTNRYYVVCGCCEKERCGGNFTNADCFEGVGETRNSSKKFNFENTIQ